MLGGSPHLQMVSSPEPGDLAFFGAGHVELYVKPGETFGALHGGTVVGFHPYGGWWVPTGFLRVVLPSKSRVAVRLRRMAPGRVMPGAIVLR
jgi:hypothetical protein